MSKVADRRVIISADDFGLSVAVNEAVELAYHEGILNTASLMVAGDAAADAVQRARRMPGLHVGLHLVVIEGPAVLSRAMIPGLLAPGAGFPSDQFALGVRYFFTPEIRRQLRLEIEAQFDAFMATGLRLDHANAHKHMHLHPTVGRLLIEEGKRRGLPAVRVPAEPPSVMARCGERLGLGASALWLWTNLLRAQVRRAGLAAPDHVFGLHWTGRMTRDRVLRLLAHLPPGVSEIYFHPATGADDVINRLMPDYQHSAELATLLDTTVAAAMPPRTTYS